MIRRALVAALLLLGALPAGGAEYLQRDEFLALAFPGQSPVAQTLWLRQEQRERALSVLGVEPATIRVRFWQVGLRTAWVLDQIGRDQPITLGIVIDGGRITTLRVMAFRESRGWEIRHPFFTDQFAGATLAGGSLDRGIDGITGATLSVRATDRAARLALWLDSEARRHVSTP